MTIVTHVRSWAGMRRLWRIGFVGYMLFSLVIFFYKGVYEAVDTSQGYTFKNADFYYFYTAGALWRSGEDPYDYDTFWDGYLTIGGHNWQEVFRSGFVYPPQATVMFSLMTFVSPEHARLGMIGLSILLALVVCAMLLYILSWYRPIGMLEVALVVSLLNTGTVRNALRGQIGLLICFIVLATLIWLYHCREAAAGVTLALLSIKPTNLPLLLGYSLLRRPLHMLIACLVAGFGLTIAPILLTGRSVVETMLSWLGMIGRFQSTDYLSPFTPYSAIMVQLEIIIYRLLNQLSPAARIVSQVIVLALIAFSTLLIVRRGARREYLLIDGALLSALTLVSTYHLTYDMGLLFPALICFYLMAVTARTDRARWLWGAYVVASVALLTIPGSLLTDHLPRLLGLPLHDYYWYRLVVPFQAWLCLGMFTTLLWLAAAPERIAALRLPISASGQPRQVVAEAHLPRLR